jgi:hypothetical protein
VREGGEIECAAAELRTDGAALESEMRRGGQQVAIVGPDFAEARLNGGHDVDSVSGAQRRGFRQRASQHLDLMQHMIADWDEEPTFSPEYPPRTEI